MLKQEKLVRLYLDNEKREGKSDLTFKINFIDFLKELGMLEKNVEYKVSNARNLDTQALTVSELIIKPKVLKVSDDFISKTIEIINYKYNKNLSLLSTLKLEDGKCETVDITKPFLELISSIVETKDFTIHISVDDMYIYPNCRDKK